MIELTKKQTEALKLAQSEKYNFILYGGAIRGGKTVWGLCTLLVLCELFPGSRWAVVRQNNERIRKTTIPSFKKLESNGILKQSPFEYTHYNKSTILFIGENFDRDKDLDAFKGLEVNGFLFEEINECQQQTFNKAFERAGSWIIPKTYNQPKPIILATCNPTHGWVKEVIYDKWVSGTLNKNWAYVPAKITDNPYLPESYLESLKNLPVYEYEVYVNGNWDLQLKTGGEFWEMFELNKHVKPVNYVNNSEIHISVDQNVYPYIAISIWQFIERGDCTVITQIDEIPCKDPYNTARAAGNKVVSYLQNIGYQNVVYVYGDQTTTARNAIDDEKKSFFTKLTDEIDRYYPIVKRMPSQNPPVAISGEFVNAIYEKNYANLIIEIGEHCTTSINDYINTKKDVNGKILKKRITDHQTGISYEPNGHFSDIKRYLITQAFKQAFEKFKRRYDDTHDNYTIGGRFTDRSF